MKHIQDDGSITVQHLTASFLPTVVFVDWGKLVLNIERGFKYHAVSSFARFIESTATQKNKILINVAYLLQLSHDFSVLLFCCFFYVLPLVILTIIYCLIPFHYSYCFHLILPLRLAASLHLFQYLCCCLSLSNIVPQCFCLPERHFLSPPLPTKEENSLLQG